MPIVKIEKLLKYGQKFKYEELHNQEKPIATLIALQANKAKRKHGPPVKSEDAYHFEMPDGNLDIDPDVPGIIFAQTRKKEFPQWALHPDIFPLKRLSMMKESPAIAHYDVEFWYNDDLMIVGGQIEDNWLYCKYAQINLFAGFIEIQPGLTIYVPVDLYGGLVVHYRFWRVENVE